MRSLGWSQISRCSRDPIAITDSRRPFSLQFGLPAVCTSTWALSDSSHRAGDRVTRIGPAVFLSRVSKHSWSVQRGLNGSCSTRAFGSVPSERWKRPSRGDHIISSTMTAVRRDTQYAEVTKRLLAFWKQPPAQKGSASCVDYFRETSAKKLILLESRAVRDSRGLQEKCFTAEFLSAAEGNGVGLK